MSVVSGLSQAEATRSAANTATDAQREGIASEWKMYEQMREDYAPWLKVGEKALGTLEGAVEEPSKYFKPKEQPGYEFGFKNFIEKPYLSSQSAKGQRLSGATLKGLTKYASDYAETSYNNFLDRYYRLAGFGSNVTNAMGQAGQGYANSIAQLQGNVGAYQAQIPMGQAQAIGNISGSAQKGYNNYMMYKYLNSGSGGGAGAGATTWGGPGGEAGSEYMMGVA